MRPELGTKAHTATSKTDGDIAKPKFTLQRIKTFNCKQENSVVPAKLFYFSKYTKNLLSNKNVEHSAPAIRFLTVLLGTVY